MFYTLFFIIYARKEKREIIPVQKPTPSSNGNDAGKLEEKKESVVTENHSVVIAVQQPPTRENSPISQTPEQSVEMSSSQ